MRVGLITGFVEHVIERSSVALATAWDRFNPRPRLRYEKINICERWAIKGGQGFKNFLEDMGERPKNTTIDRIDSAGNYEPSNCRWVNHQLQTANRKFRKRASLSKSGYRGVSRDGSAWVARTTCPITKKILNLHRSTDPIECAKWYDVAIKIKFGDYAITNFESLDHGWSRRSTL